MNLPVKCHTRLLNYIEAYLDRSKPELVTRRTMEAWMWLSSGLYSSIVFKEHKDFCSGIAWSMYSLIASQKNIHLVDVLNVEQSVKDIVLLACEDVVTFKPPKDETLYEEWSIALSEGRYDISLLS